MAWLDSFREFIQTPEVAGVGGALVSLRWLPVGSTWANKASSLAAGLGVALWLVPLCAEVLGMKSLSAICGLAFVGGVAGLLLLSRLIDYLTTTPVGEWIGSLFTKRQQ